jgi:hypothetical protein
MICGNCGDHNAYLFNHAGITSVRCPYCKEDLLPGVVIDRDVREPLKTGDRDEERKR